MNVRRAVRALLAWGPLAIALATACFLAGSAGGYTATWMALRRTLDRLAPGHAPISDYGVTLYQLNEAVRRAAHSLVAAIVVVLADRGPGAHFPLRRRIPIALGIGAMVVAGAALVRWQTNDRHVRIEQWLPTLLGLALGLGWILIAAAGRRLARWAEEPTPEPPTAPPPA